MTDAKFADLVQCGCYRFALKDFPERGIFAALIADRLAKKSFELITSGDQYFFRFHLLALATAVLPFTPCQGNNRAMDQNELTTATTRLQNAKAALLELDHQERVKTVRSTADCWKHIVRFADAMKSVPIVGFNERTLWMNEIHSQMEFSRTLLQDQKV